VTRRTPHERAGRDRDLNRHLTGYDHDAIVIAAGRR
jgi:hypothetical protein